jgi:hypothetical protein
MRSPITWVGGLPMGTSTRGTNREHLTASAEPRSMAERIELARRQHAAPQSRSPVGAWDIRPSPEWPWLSMPESGPAKE